MFRSCMQPAALSLLIMLYMYRCKHLQVKIRSNFIILKIKTNTHYHLLGHLDYKKSLYIVVLIRYNLIT